MTPLLFIIKRQNNWRKIWGYLKNLQNFVWFSLFFAVQWEHLQDTSYYFSFYAHSCLPYHIFKLNSYDNWIAISNSDPLERAIFVNVCAIFVYKYAWYLWLVDLLPRNSPLRWFPQRKGSRIWLILKLWMETVLMKSNLLGSCRHGFISQSWKTLRWAVLRRLHNKLSCGAYIILPASRCWLSFVEWTVLRLKILKETGLLIEGELFTLCEFFNVVFLPPTTCREWSCQKSILKYYLTSYFLPFKLPVLPIMEPVNFPLFELHHNSPPPFPKECHKCIIV